MPKYSETSSILGSRIMKFRKDHNLTQADLAERYSVSGPAIFKFEKGFVTPSLKLWLKIAANIGIPEKEAVLIWVREKLPTQMKNLVSEMPVLDIDAVTEELQALEKDPDGFRKMRDVLLNNADLSPALKKFVATNEMWNTMKPTPKEVLFLINLTQTASLVTLSHFRDAIMIARDIQNPEA